MRAVESSDKLQPLSGRFRGPVIDRPSPWRFVHRADTGRRATLKAMGYTDRTLFAVVLYEALLLSLLGFVPGWSIAYVLYTLTRRATLLPIEMAPERVLLVFVLTVVMCAGSGAVAMRRLRSADPAEIF
jgi:DevC protein